MISKVYIYIGILEFSQGRSRHIYSSLKYKFKNILNVGRLILCDKSSLIENKQKLIRTFVSTK